MTVTEYILGDVLLAKENFIAQQCNCLSVRPHGLSQSIATKYPHGDAYARRRPTAPGRNTACIEDRPEPGSLLVLAGTPNVVCLFAQWAPGSTTSQWIRRYPFRGDSAETREEREKWFGDAILRLDEHNLQEPVAVPERIGCGLAGGNWSTYLSVLEKASTDFVIYKYVSSLKL